MSRGRYSTGSSSTSAATILATDRILQKEATFQQEIKKIHTHTILLAESLALSGAVESSLQSSESSDNDMNDVHNFLNEQRSKLKLLTERHVQSSRDIKAFMDATQEIRKELIANSAAEDAGENPPDYESILNAKVESQKQKQESNMIDIKNEEMMIKVRERLGEKEQSSSKNDDDNDELEIMNVGESISDYKCPLTGQFFVNPVKNKVCKHVYELEGIRHHLRMKRHCPVMGCNNNQVTEIQCEPDEEMKMKVRRYKHRVETKKKKQQASQEYDEEFMDDENEFDDGGNGTTVIE
mmetsp:Transcript_19841/g.24471  ORF Transcript_19841/g.24471 Transcript_19841/m.24471 type:complete len:296 (+) Transcript_19841:286-1173(+)